MREGGQLPAITSRLSGLASMCKEEEFGAGVELINSTASIVDGVIESDLFAHSSELDD